MRTVMILDEFASQPVLFINPQLMFIQVQIEYLSTKAGHETPKLQDV